MTALTIAALCAAVAVAIGVLAFLVSEREAWNVEETPERFRVMRRAYERTLRAIKDLDFDARAGTLSEAENAALQADYKARAITLRKALDRSRMGMVRRIAAGQAARPTRDERAKIEKLVARARAAGKELSKS